MKKHTFIFLAFIPFLLSAQKVLKIDIPFDDKLNKYSYQEVVELNKSDSLLYNNAILWISTEFGSKDFDINEQNKKITKEFSFEISYTFNGGMGIKLPMKYTILMDLTLEFKTERYRYQLTNFKISQNENATTPESTLETFISSYYEMGIGKRRLGKMIEEICLEIDEGTKTWVEKMKTGMDSEIKTDDDW